MVCVSPGATLPDRWEGSVLQNTDDPRLLRGPMTQAAYCRHNENHGPKIREGWQRNLFGYNVITSTLSVLTGKEWGHYVYANRDGVDSLLMMAFMYGLGIPEWICSVNPPNRQSQPHLPHGHAFMPTRIAEPAIAELKRIF